MIPLGIMAPAKTNKLHSKTISRLFQRTEDHGGYLNAFLAAALTRVMRATVPIPALASASVLHSAAVDGSVVGVVRPL